MLSKIPLSIYSILLIAPAISCFPTSNTNGLKTRGGRFDGTIMSRQAGATSTLDLTYEYMTVTLGVGNPPQSQTLTFDMGSPFL